MVGYFEHIAPDGLLGRGQFGSCRSISGKQDAAALAAHSDDGRVFVLLTSLVLCFRCFHDF